MDWLTEKNEDEDFGWLRADTSDCCASHVNLALEAGILLQLIQLQWAEIPRRQQE